MGPRSTVLMASDSANPSENNDVYDQPIITNNVTKSKLDKYNTNAAPNPRTETMTITSGPLPGSPD